MLKFNRSIIAWTLVILWMALIFYLSHQPATQSSELSRGSDCGTCGEGLKPALAESAIYGRIELRT